MKRVECVVIGGGIAGSATAWWLSRLGREVTLLEQFEPGHARGSSHGAVRIFRFAYQEADYIRLAMDALPLWRLAESECGETLVELTGGIDFGDVRAIETLGRAMEQESAEFEWLEASAAMARFPGFNFDGPVLFQPQGGRCHAARSVAAFQRLAADRGAEVRFEEPVLALDGSGEHAIVTTDRDEYEADVCVVAAGAWVQRLAGALFPLPRLSVTREQPAYFSPLDPAVDWPSFIEHRRPGEGAFGCYGLYSADDGLKVGVHMSGAEADPDEPAAALDEAALAALQQTAGRILPGVRPEPVRVEQCLYTTTPSEDFIIERAGPVVVASPCSGHGFKFGPAIGRMVAEFALGMSEPLPRFRLGRTAAR